MGSGSSRGGRARRRLRGADSGPAGPAGPGGGGPAASATAAGAEGAPGAAGAAGRDPDASPAAPSDGRDETLRLLDQLLAESAAWGPEEPAPRCPLRPRPTRDAGSRVSPEERAEGHAESGSLSEAPGSSHKRPETQSVILYDCSEEELMASIEQEYCR